MNICYIFIEYLLHSFDRCLFHIWLICTPYIQIIKLGKFFPVYDGVSMYGVQMFSELIYNYVNLVDVDRLILKNLEVN